MSQQTQTIPFIFQMEPSFDKNEAQALHDYILSGGWVTEFKKTKEFEDSISEFTKSKNCIIVSNGTISLSLALLAGGIKAGDEVIIPNLTMIATATACVLIGAKPVFVDVDDQTLCLDIALARKAINSKTKALMHVSFNGRTNDLNEFKSLCSEKNIVFIEDAAQALGSLYKDKHIGTYGDIGSFSFSAPKIITTGQGGALVTNNEIYASALRKLKDFGRLKGGCDIHDSIGFNFKFTDLQAIIGIEQMKKLPYRVKRKKEIYSLYETELSELTNVEFVKTDLSQTAPWFIDIFVDDPDNLSVFLKTKNIGSRKIYPPLNAQQAFNVKGSFPITERFSSRGLWLPSSSTLTNEQVKCICKNIKEYYS